MKLIINFDEVRNSGSGVATQMCEYDLSFETLCLGGPPFEVNDVLFLGKLDEFEFETGIRCLEHAQECGYGVGPDLIDGFICVCPHRGRAFGKQAIEPIAQGFALIGGFGVWAQQPPGDKAQNGKEQCDW